MKIRLWKGYHEPELAPLIQNSWDQGVLLILCPPLLSDFSFLSVFPAGELEVFGQWSSSEKELIALVDRRGGFDFPAAPVLGVFTSGTLSPSPRLVLYSRANVEASLKAIFSLFDVSRLQHVFCYPQAFHTFGLTLGYLSAHLMGWKLHTPQGKYQTSSHQARLSLQSDKVLTLGTPTHFYDLIQLIEKQGLSIQPSYTCIMGGASVSRDLWLKVQSHLKIEAPSIGYGCTEASPGITHLPPGVAPLDNDEIGFPLASLISVVRPDLGVEISGESLCMAVVQDQKVSFPKSLMIRDRIALDARGGWIYRGRLDLLLNRGGAKYSLEAIERTLLEKLGVAAIACAVRDSRLGEDLGLAMVSPANTSSVDLIANGQSLLRDTFGIKLAAEHVRWMPELPLNESAKPDRRTVWTLFGEQRTITPV